MSEPKRILLSCSRGSLTRRMIELLHGVDVEILTHDSNEGAARRIPPLDLETAIQSPPVNPETLVERPLPETRAQRQRRKTEHRRKPSGRP